MTATMNMTTIRNILAKVASGESLTEEETFHLQAMYGLVEDKDAPTLLNEVEAMEQDLAIMEEYFFGLTKEYTRLNRKVKVCKAKHIWKNHLRDKSKAGWHNGSRKEGWGRYDLWGLPEKSHKDQKADLEAQMKNLTEEEFTFNANEIKKELMLIFDQYIDGMNVVFYHHTADFALLSPWNNKCRSWMEKKLKDMPSEGDVYSYLEDTYPEMGMADMKSVVEDFISGWRLDILMKTSFMWKYCQNANRAYREELLFDLKLSYGKLDSLTGEIRVAKSSNMNLFTGKFSIILAQIESLKMKLEEMEKANAKFI